MMHISNFKHSTELSAVYHDEMDKMELTAFNNLTTVFIELSS